MSKLINCIPSGIPSISIHSLFDILFISLSIVRGVYNYTMLDIISVVCILYCKNNYNS